MVSDLNIFGQKLSKIAAIKYFFTNFFLNFFTFEVLLTRLCAPTSWSRTSNIFRDSESLRKSIGNKWSWIWTFFLKNGLKLPVQIFFTVFSSPLFTPFKRLFAPNSQSQMSKLLRFSESFGKTNGKKWSKIWNFLLLKDVKSPRQKKFDFWRILPY